MKFIIEFEKCPILGQRYLGMKYLPTKAQKSKKHKNTSWKKYLK